MRVNLQVLPQVRHSCVRAAAPLSVAALAVAMVASPLGCGDGPTKTKEKSLTTTSTSTSTSSPSNGLDLVDPADDAFGDMPAAKSGAKRGAGAPATAAATGSTASVGGKGRWSVMIATFSQEDHSSATVRRVGKGSAIVLGRFEAPDDKAAQTELKRVKALERNGQKPFAGVMLMRVATDDASATLKPTDIRNLRSKFPSVRPLFSLQVAAWSTFGEKGSDYAPMRTAAERYCAELRAKGHEAWFHHDEDSETSIVAVGHFDRRAYDARTTLFSPEVEDLMRQFPAHLLNGEPLLVPVDASNPKGKTKPQPCRLVEVPES
jgi:hypothetical protein